MNHGIGHMMGYPLWDALPLRIPYTPLGYSTTSGIPRGMPYSPEYPTYPGHKTWGPVQTCSLEALTPPLVLISSGGHQSVRYPSYYNAFLYYYSMGISGKQHFTMSAQKSLLSKSTKIKFSNMYSFVDVEL